MDGADGWNRYRLAAALYAPGVIRLEHMIELHIAKRPEGVCISTSDKPQDLIAQSSTIHKTVEIAGDVATKLMEAHAGGHAPLPPPLRECFSVRLVVATAGPARPVHR